MVAFRMQRLDPHIRMENSCDANINGLSISGILSPRSDSGLAIFFTGAVLILCVLPEEAAFAC